MNSTRVVRAWQIALVPIYLAIFLGIAHFNRTVRPATDPAGDQDRYRQFAENLASGAYTWSYAPDLTNAPGYPIVLLPFAALDIPWSVASWLNVMFVVFAFGYVYKALALYVSTRAALVGALFVGLYPPLMMLLPYQMTEPLAACLAAAFTYYACSALHGSPEPPHVSKAALLAGLFLGLLALTKAIFGHVITVGLAVSLICMLPRGTRAAARRPALILAVAFVTCLPWLIYTFAVTGKPFYWSSSGGENLYWMTTPYKAEYGEWHSKAEVYAIPGLDQNHGELYRSLEGKSRVERSQVFTQQAMQNIREQPVKYARNIVSNVGRLLFNYPHSYTLQSPNTLLYIASNIFLVVAGALALAGFLWRLLKRKVTADQVMIGGLFLVALGGSSVVAATPRYFIMLVPLAVVLVAQSARETRIMEWIRHSP